MVKWVLLDVLLVIVIVFALITNPPANAQEVAPSHFTLIINQIRGSECCDSGTVAFFEQQLTTVEELKLLAHFALRYDALIDPEYQVLLHQHDQVAYGALLEVTPALAAMAGVTYKGTPNQWYEAQNVFLIGYEPADRRRLIDTYMDQFRAEVGVYPQFSVAWMIDPWSLKYLKTKYGVVVHELTREQFGTDSYTLYGGPMQYPYWPSDNWALIPSEHNPQQPLIVRQTVMDPVFNYGDRSNSYTTQPNDYALRKADLSYFTFLFNQAHRQPNPYTFAMLGIENSMPTEVQLAYVQQLRQVAEWQQQSENQVVSVSVFEQWLRQHQSQPVMVYGGSSQHDSAEQAWWITTNRYRVRLRLSQGQLSISDLRVYDQSFSDPYLEKTAHRLGWWVVPFVIDSSRKYSQDNNTLIVHNDTLVDRPEKFGQPDQIRLASGVGHLVVSRDGQRVVVKDGERILARFDHSGFELSTPSIDSNKMSWTTGQGQVWWEFLPQQLNSTTTRFEPHVNQQDLANARVKQPNWLFPELVGSPIDVQKSSIYVNNEYAVAGRNPVRLVFFPQDTAGNSVLLNDYPQVSTTEPVDTISQFVQQGNSGMVFIDLIEAQPLQTSVVVKYQGFADQIEVFFAPNCRADWQYCLQHPGQTWWYFKAVWADRQRAQQQQADEAALFVE